MNRKYREQYKHLESIKPLNISKEELGKAIKILLEQKKANNE